MSVFRAVEKKRNFLKFCRWRGARSSALCVLADETDSGLDIDALKIVDHRDGVNALRSPDRAMLVITHYQRLLDYIKADKVHVLAQGKIRRSGGPELALELEQKALCRLCAG